MTLNENALLSDSDFQFPDRSAKAFWVHNVCFSFFFFGGWAAPAPIDRAAVATGIVNVRSYSKFIQHLRAAHYQRDLR